MDIHVLTPFSRPANIPVLLSSFEQSNITWHIISHAPETITHELPSWVIVHDCGEDFRQSNQSGPIDPCYWKLNWWIQTQQIDDASRYCFLCDDDGFESGYYDRIRESGLGPVVVTSMYRGHHQPTGVSHPTSTLNGCDANMRQCHVGLEQFSVTGEVLRKMRFENHMCGDGKMAEWLAANYPITCLPEVFAWFNWLEQCPWESERKLLILPNAT